MTIRHHPTDETLAAYAAGTLDPGRRLVVASHVERCAACRGFLRGIERVAGVMLEDLSPAPMPPDALTHTLARIDREPAVTVVRSDLPPASLQLSDEPNLPACLKPFEMGRWRWVGPGVGMRSIIVPDAGNVRVFLLKGSPGIQLPQHTHKGTELTSILSGSFHHDGGDFYAGDFEEADDSVEHRPVVGKDKACICLVALDGQLKLSGWMGALLNPFVRL